MTQKEYNKSVDLHSKALFRFIFKNLNVREDAENIVQDTFESLWINREKVEFEKCKSWIFTTAYRKMIDGIRREKKITEMPESYREKGREAAQPDLKSIVNKAMELLPEMQKSVIMLRDYEGYDYAEIGKITGLNESQVKVYIFRARQTLKNYLVSLENII
ncbi:MAG: RNA polymerase sigma factor [Bacteroidia bacterium]|nr:RNA polymerase sigma factor [Bacteroidia bacterium]